MRWYHYYYWESAAGTGPYYRLNTEVEAVIGRSDSTGYNTGEILRVPTTTRFRQTARLAAHTLVSGLPSRDRRPHLPPGLQAVTTIASLNVYLVPSTALTPVV
jgi:hypothetical protein